jgi:phage virion morphogenesis protein
MEIKLEFNDSQVQELFNRLQRKAEDTTPLMQTIAYLAESKARESFIEERAPDGTAWKPSQRVLEKGGKTLTLYGHLSDSISSSYGKDYAQWGANRSYAALHQFGGVTGNGARVPQRKFLPDSLEELGGEDLVKLIEGYLID